MVKITSVHDNIIEGLVKARCSVGYYKVRIRINGFKIVESECECGNKICRHAIQLYLHYIRVKGNDNNDKTFRGNST